MPRSLADALLDDLLPDGLRTRPAKARKPYLAEGTPVTCEGGHAVGTVYGDLPRTGDDARDLPDWLLRLDVAFKVWNGGGAMIDWPLLGYDDVWRAWAVEAGRWPEGLEPPTRRYLDVLEQPVPRGLCPLCGSRFFRWIMPRSGAAPSSFRLHTPDGWDGRRRAGRRRRP